MRESECEVRLPAPPPGLLTGADWVKKGVAPCKVAEAERESKARLEHMSPPGKLGLPPLLEQRRWEIGMIDQLFSQAAVYERLLLYQITTKEFEGGTAGTSGIIVPDATLSRDLKEAPRAVVVSAGLNALDYLHSHGMGVGCIVTICREAPYGIRVAVVGGKYYSLIIVDAGDVCASEDLADEMREGRARIVEDVGEHKLTNAKGESWTPDGMWADRLAAQVVVKKRTKKALKKVGGRVRATRAIEAVVVKKPSKKSSKKKGTPRAPRVRPGY